MNVKKIIFLIIMASMITFGCLENPLDIEKINKTAVYEGNIIIPINNTAPYNESDAGAGIRNFSCDPVREANGDRDICKASLMGNTSFCESISTDDLKEECYRIFTINEIFENRVDNAVKICDTFILNPDRKAICLATAKNDPSFCENITRNTSQENRDLCFYSVVLLDKVRNTSDRLEICTNIHDFTSRQICAAVVSGNAHYCDDNFDLDKFIVNCYLELAAFGDISTANAEYVCSAIKGDSKYFCMAQVRKDATLCDSIENTNLRNNCYLQVVLYRNYRHNN